MHTKQAKRTKARRGYDLICEAALRVQPLLTSELMRVARAINPKVEDFQTHYLVMQDVVWIGEPALSGSLHCLAQRSSVEDWDARLQFVFCRERLADRTSRLTRSDLRLVYDFPGGDKRGTVWLDALTGLPWLPEACISTAHTQERREGLFERHAADSRIARRVLAEIEAEKCRMLFWQIDNVRSTLYQHVEVLQELDRPSSKAEWRVTREIAWKYFPSEAAA